MSGVTDASDLPAAALDHDVDRALESHWQVIDDWPPSRQLCACYATTGDQPELRAHIAAFQRELTAMSALDLISPEWLHMTVQGIRFTDEVDVGTVSTLTVALGHALAALAPVRVVVERPVITGDSVLMPVRPAEPVAALRDEIRRVLLTFPQLRELYALPGQDGAFDPHFSIAYVSGPISARELATALARCPLAPLEINLQTVSMLTLMREQPRYHWVDERPIRLGG